MQPTPRPDDLDRMSLDLYRGIHKGIRAELFAVTSIAGSVDPTDRSGRLALADHVASVAQVLALHAEREDAVIEPVLHEHLPHLGERIVDEHRALEPRVASLVELAADAATADTAGVHRRLGEVLYLELSDFTSVYLAHQLVEEREVMPALEQAVGVEAVAGMQEAILSSISPADLAASLAFMLPAMNADDRGELLGLVKATTPPDAFASIVSLSRSVLDPVEFTATAARLNLSS